MSAEKPGLEPAAERPQTPAERFLALLGEGMLGYQSCDSCGNSWLPPSLQCPRCLGKEWSWRESTGEARLVSWVVYHRAFEKDFAERVPYNVALVELEEGPRLITNVVDVAGGEGLELDLPVRFRADEQKGVPVAHFVTTTEGA